jgi:hypothetical protein
MRDADADEQLSEDEVVRIATGARPACAPCAPRAVRAAGAQRRPRWYDRYFEPPVFSVPASCPAAQTTLRRIEEYLVTREYLQIVRGAARTSPSCPADDTISSLARAFFRPGSRVTTSRVRRACSSASTTCRRQRPRPLRRRPEPGPEQQREGRHGAGRLRRLHRRRVAAIVAGVDGPGLGPVPEILAFGGGMAATIAASPPLRRRAGSGTACHAAKLELTGLLDRLEHGERLEPPPAPWRRRLLFGAGTTRPDRIDRGCLPLHIAAPRIEQSPTEDTCRRSARSPCSAAA